MGAMEGLFQRIVVLMSIIAFFIDSADATIVIINETSRNQWTPS